MKILGPNEKATSGLVALAGQSLADGDLLAVTDVSASSSRKATMADLAFYVANQLSLPPSGAIAQSINRSAGGAIANTAASLSSGRLHLVAVWLPANTTVTSISWYTGTTAASGTVSHWMFGLFDSSRVPLRSTADQTSTAWGASTIKTVNLTSTFVTTYTGLHYLGMFIVATVPTLMCATSTTVATGQAPITSGFSSTGLTTAMPNPAAAITATLFVPWAWCS